VISFLTDENFDRAILRGLLRREPTLNIVRVQEVGLRRRPDPEVLELSAQQGRIVLSHDIKTMPRHAYERVEQGLPMPGLFVVRATLPIAQAIDEILLAWASSNEGEWEGQVLFIPM
jgi:Domain of unknown function (DUF5615)